MGVAKKSMSDWLCPDLAHSLFVERNPQGNPQIAFCCNAMSQPAETVDQNDPVLARERNISITQGILPPSCIRCSRSEELGAPSRRTAIIEHYRSNDIHLGPDIQLHNLDFNCQTVCNLKCIMCNGDYSSSWHDDEVKLGITNQRSTPKNRNLAQEISAKDLRRVHFNGGEPFMSNDHIHLLQKIIKEGNPEKCQLSYNTNGTYIPTNNVLKLWQQFQLVKVYFSIDAINEQFEYIRFPAKWNDVTQNIQWWKQLNDPCVILEFNVSVGVQNILYLPQLIDWIENTVTANAQGDPVNTSVQLVTHPSLGLENLPVKNRKLAIDILKNLSYYNWSNGLLTHLENNATPNTEWKNWLSKLDHIRQNNWQTSLSLLI